MFTILQDSSNNLQLPFKGNYDFLLIVFEYRNKTVNAVFENTAGIGCDYEFNVIEVGEDGTVDVNNGEIKLSPRGTWKATIYGQDNNTNLATVNATELYSYDFQVKGESCKVYPTDVNSCPDATAIVQDQDGNELARENIASGAQQIITVNTGEMISVAKGDFEGVFDLPVVGQEGYYNDYTEGDVITSLSLSVDPQLGSKSTVRILGGLLGPNAIPEAWDKYNDVQITQDSTKWNVLILIYHKSDDVRITNSVIDAPDLVAPEFTSAPTAINIAETSFDITAQLNENGTVYGYLLADASPAPTVQEIIDNAQSQFSDSGSGGTLSFTGLTNETNYDVYVVAVDTAGNRQANSTLVEVLTQSSVTAGDIAIARYPSLTITEQTAIKLFVDTLDNLGKWDLIDEVAFLDGLTNEADALIGGKSKTFTKIGSPTYSQGFVFTPSSGINTNFTPSIDGVNFTLNNNSVGGFPTAINATSAASLFGVLDNNIFAVTLQQNNDGTNNLFYRNNVLGNTGYDTIDDFEINTLYAHERTSVSNIAGYKDTVSTPSVDTSEGLPELPIYIGNRNNRGAADQGLQGRVMFWFIGASGIIDADFVNTINQLKTDLGI